MVGWPWFHLGTFGLIEYSLGYGSTLLCKENSQPKEDDPSELDWQAAIDFVSKCQNLPESNPQQWVSSHEEDRGGFIYFPGNSMAGERTDENGSISLRSYGSMSYAGLLSFIYAEMESGDPRVIAVKEWLNQKLSNR